jgi:hypothetical protein
MFEARAWGSNVDAAPVTRERDESRKSNYSEVIDPARGV